MEAIPTDGPHRYARCRGRLLDDLDNPAAARFDQNRAAIHDRIAILPGGAVFRRHVVIGDAFLRQNRADADVLAILIGPVSYTHLRAHETDSYLVCRLLLEKKK